MFANYHMEMKVILITKRFLQRYQATILLIFFLMGLIRDNTHSGLTAFLDNVFQKSIYGSI